VAASSSRKACSAAAGSSASNPNTPGSLPPNSGGTLMGKRGAGKRRRGRVRGFGLGFDRRTGRRRGLGAGFVRVPKIVISASAGAPGAGAPPDVRTTTVGVSSGVADGVGEGAGDSGVRVGVGAGLGFGGV